MIVDGTHHGNGDSDADETREWLDSFTGVLQAQGTDRASYLLTQLKHKAFRSGVDIPFTANTPYINTIPRERQAPFPGSREIERRIKSLVRWNAMAMVVRANKKTPGIGGHISTYASAATLYEIGYNHFFRGPEAPGGADLVYFQGHASPGIYARAFLEGRLSAKHLENFRREMAEGGGLSSYPHPWLMPHFWQFPTVSMGLGPIMAIYQARYNRYLLHRGLKDTSQQRVWCFLGDGETDEPESLGALTLASREKLDNLIFVVNCNLQRLDGPVRGNGKIIQELEAAFRGAGWNVIKVIWSSAWDTLFAMDKDGFLAKRMEEVVDGEFQKYGVEAPSYTRQHFFGKYPELAKLVENLSDDQIRKLSRGGHDPEKVFAAYHEAVNHTGSPTVILAKTVKGYGLGEAGEGRNITHQAKKLNEDELAEFRTRFGIPISDDELHELPFYKPPEDSRELHYLHQRRQALGGPTPFRAAQCPPLKAPPLESFSNFLQGSGAGNHLQRRWLLSASSTSCFRTKRSTSGSCRSFPTRRVPSAWRACSPQVRHLPQCGPALRSLWIRRLRAVTAKPRTARSWKRESPRRAPCRPSSRPAPPIYHGMRPDDSVLHLLFNVRFPCRVGDLVIRAAGDS